MSYVESNFRSLFFALLANFMLFGICTTITGATLPEIIRDLNWNYTAIGVVLSAGSIGYLMSTLISGILLQRLSIKPVIVTGLVLQAMGLSLFLIHRSVFHNMLMNLLIGLGEGATVVAVNLSVVRIERDGQSRLMNLTYAAFSVGAVIGPFVVIALMKAELSWQIIYRLMALLFLLMASALLLLPFSRLAKEKAKSGDKQRTVAFLKRPLLILSFLILFIYAGSQSGVSSWVSEYYMRVFSKSASAGAFIVSIFWIGMLIGRLGVSFGYRGFRQAELAFILASISTIALLFTILMTGSWLAGVGIFLSGLGYSAIYPTVIAIVGQHFKRIQSIAVGFATTGAGIGSFVFPYIMAVIGNRFGIQRGFLFFIALNITMVMLITAVIWQTRAPAKNGDMK